MNNSLKYLRLYLLQRFTWEKINFPDGTSLQYNEKLIQYEHKNSKGV